MRPLNDNNWELSFYQHDFADIVLTHNAHDVFKFMIDVGNMKHHDLIYDQCCGKGTLLNEFLLNGFNVTGVDLVPEYIQAAKKMLFETQEIVFRHSGNHLNIDLRAGDARRDLWADPVSGINAADGAINWYTSFAGSDKQEDNEAMISALSFNLKKGGCFFISTMNPAYVIRNFQHYIVREVSEGISTMIIIRKCFIENRMMKSKWTTVHADGKREYGYGQTFMYTVEEMITMLAKYHLKVERAFGGIDKHPFDWHSKTMILFGHKAL